MLNKKKLGQITIEISSLMPEKILNVLWDNEIYTCSIVRVDLATIRFAIYINDYKKVEEIIKKYKGKVRIINSSGIIVLIMKMKGKISLVIGTFIFFAVIYFLSNYIWAVDIQTQKNLSPFEIRQQLSNIGIKPGLKKSQINVRELEFILILLV